MLILSPERKNIIMVGSRRPIKAIGLFKAFSSNIVTRLLNRSFPNNKRRTKVRIARSLPALSLDLSRLPVPNVHTESDIPLPQILLASQKLDAMNQIEWRRSFKDQEDVFALHRFIWLLIAMMEQPNVKRSQQALHWIEDWIDVMGGDRSHPAWESYSVAERLVNWPFILAIVNKYIQISDEFLAKIETSMQIHLEYLLDNLEYRGLDTNNHILNDARGLYIGGIVMGHETSVTVSKHLFREWTPKLLHPDGMLKEHSSHYQCLILWRYEQVHRVASHTKETEFVNFLNPWIEKMQKAKEFFSVYSPEGLREMPLFGDISPDISPFWLEIFKDVWKESSHGSKLSLPPTSPWKLMCGFYRYDIDDVVVFWHVEEDGLNYRGHGHYDLGGFVFFYKGRQVFADIGRCSYLRSGLSACAASAHNTLLVDGMGAFCEESWLNELLSHQKQNVLWKIKLSENRLICKMWTDGFLRLYKPVYWERIFELDQRQFTIVDCLKSSGRNKVNTHFIFDPRINVSPNEDRLVLSRDDGMEMMFSAAGKFRDIRQQDRLYYNEYGQSEPTKSVVYCAELEVTMTQRFELRW